MPPVRQNINWTQADVSSRRHTITDVLVNAFITPKHSPISPTEITSAISLEHNPESLKVYVQPIDLGWANVLWVSSDNFVEKLKTWDRILLKVLCDISLDNENWFFVVKLYLTEKHSRKSGGRVLHT